MTALWTWLTSHQAFFALLVTNLIVLLNGLLPHITAGKYQSAVGKALVLLRWLLDLINPATAKDSPGTFKLPFTWSKVPVDNGGAK